MKIVQRYLEPQSANHDSMMKAQEETEKTLNVIENSIELLFSKHHELIAILKIQGKEIEEFRD